MRLMQLLLLLLGHIHEYIGSVEIFKQTVDNRSTIPKQLYVEYS